ncbi:AAA family ATPase [Planotetraspora sp. A-T 1434]|uniref:ATP-binding protein n=1 Tax=Planotetraspora sp. A-T 1434 TaxID=2979219 RepID=UPI0021C0BBCF|nr:LuxR family transcriptional regulator [Planotetraspora sp. A-T 1434]MCT9935319.1 AAA family ATPase [Planotetraspora sp. A-T 1434]
MNGRARRLVGRDHELGVLRDLLSTAPTARRVIFLRGDAGVGKSSLLEAAADLAAERGMRTLHASGVEGETTLPYAALHQLLHPVRRHIGDLSEEHRSALERALGQVSGAAPDAMTIGSAVLDLLALTASEQPLFLIIDDVHWFDRPSAETCAFVFRRLADYEIVTALAARSDVETPFDSARLPELEISALPESEAADLLAFAHPELGPDARREVLEQAQGNPLALEELPRAFADGRVSGDDLLPAGVPLSRRLEAVYGRRVRDLSDSTRLRLLRAALDGMRAGNAPRSRTTAQYRLRDVDEAIEMGLLVTDPRESAMAFRHPLVRSAIAQMATPNERRAAHADLAEVYRHDPERRAWHLAAATLDPDESVAAALEKAARIATLRGGSTAAVAALTRAAELSPRNADRSRRLADAAYIAGQSAQLDQAQRLLEESDRAVGAVESAASAVTSAYLALYRYGDVVSAHRGLLHALRREGGGADPETLSRLLHVLLAVSHFACDPQLWALTDAEFDRFADRVEPLTLLYRDSWGDLVHRGFTVRARLEEAFAELSSGEPWDVMRLTVSAFYVDMLAECRPALRRMVEREGEAGAITNVMTMLHVVMLDQIGSGHWDEAEATGRRGLEMTIRHGYELFAHQFRSYLGVIAASRGDLEQARELRDTVESWARPRGIGLLTQFHDLIGTLAALGAGDYETAYLHASSVTQPGIFTPYSHQAPRMLLDLVEAALHTGRSEQARRHALAAEEARLGEISPRLELLTLGSLAMTAPDDQARELYEQALARPAGGRFPFEQARIRLAYGVWLRRLHANGAAREALHLAQEAFARLGARPWLARAQLELRATGAGVRSGNGNRPQLTAQEKEIAELAATGLSNKEIGARLFLSPRTVGSHLYKIFPKLGITSRASLRDALAAMDGQQEE